MIPAQELYECDTEGVIGEAPTPSLLNAPVVQRRELVRIKTLVLSGGGTKGMAHVGALRALEQLGMLQSVRRFVGTSAGSIIAGLLGIGYTVNELYDLMMKLDFERFQDVKPADLFTNLGMDSGERLSLALREMISQKKCSPEITLLEIHKRFGISLHFTTACLNTCRLHVLNYLSEPELPLWKAIRMSTSIPGLFVPVSHRGYMYVDGGCIDNFPMSLFPSPRTLGIMLTPVRKPKPVINIEDMLQQLMVMMLNNTSRSSEYYPDTTVELMLPDISIANFKLNQQMKRQLYDIGFDRMMDRFTDVV
jgi:predicted acylesterase/phospholipase RssA